EKENSDLVNQLQKTNELVEKNNLALQQEVQVRNQLEQEINLEKEKVLNLNLVKTDFLANMSHELITPINIIIGMTTLTLDASMNEKQQKNLQNVLTSAGSLLSMVNNIFTLSQLESGESMQEKKSFDLCQVISECLKTSSIKAHKKGLELISWYRSEPLFRVVGDSGRLVTVINQILDNAIKFSTDGEVVLELQTKGLEDNHCQTVITITDQGIGIGKEKQKIIFESYMQGDSTKTRKYGGIGIGLSLAQKNIDLMDGEINLESGTGKGTSITITLAWPLDTNMELSTALTQPAAKSKTIGLFCQNITQQKVISQILSSAGYDPLLIDTFEEEGTQRQEKKLLTIVDLPVTSQNVNRLINESSSKISQPIIFITSSTYQRKTLKSHHLIPKPFRPATLINKVQNLISPKWIDPNIVDDQLNILVVENNQINQDLISLILKKKGYHIEQALDGADAVKACNKRKFDVILMDLQMPNMDGFEATRAIRKLEISLQCPPYIIALTGATDEKDRKLCLEAGMDNYLTKPIAGPQLFEMISGNAAAKKESGVAEQIHQIEPDNGELIDIKNGIKRWELNRKAFFRALAGFYRNHVKDESWLQNTIKEKNNLQIIQWVHNIKGVAANISAVHLARAAVHFEEVYGQSDEDEIALRSKALITAFKKTLQKVSELTSNEDAELDLHNNDKRRIVSDMPVITESVAKLYRALVKGEAVIAENEMEILKIHLRETDCSDDLRELSNQIEDFEFASALTILDKIKNDIGFPG
ncbi:MAG: response regulator, partial [Proteobacteria bacterium]|nr:response regulator [Pseudomonadota bacterium]